jgi:hypothetical protein
MTALVLLLGVLLCSQQIAANQQGHTARLLLAQQDGVATATYSSLWAAMQK